MSMDGLDILLICIGLAILFSSGRSIYKDWKKSKNDKFKYTDERHDVTVWTPDGKVEHFEAIEVDIKDNYVCITFEDGNEIEYEGVTLKVHTRKLK